MLRIQAQPFLYCSLFFEQSENAEMVQFHSSFIPTHFSCTHLCPEAYPFLPEISKKAFKKLLE